MPALIAIPPLPGRGYINFTCTASFVFAEEKYWSWYDEKSLCPNAVLGYYEIRYGLTKMHFGVLDRDRVGLPKFTGVADGFTTPNPGDTYVVGNGANVISVNIGSDRPFRGDTIYYRIRPGISGTLRVSVTTQLVNNSANTNRYIINP